MYRFESTLGFKAMIDNTNDLYEPLWSFAFMSVHRYGGSPSGEVLLVLTIMMLDQAGQHVTVSELADITSLPQSNVSRYVSDQLRIGHLEEEIDPKDRRRRVLRPTDEGRVEQDWLRNQMLSLSRARQAAYGKSGSEINMVELLRQTAKAFKTD